MRMQDFVQQQLLALVLENVGKQSDQCLSFFYHPGRRLINSYYKKYFCEPGTISIWLFFKSILKTNVGSNQRYWKFFLVNVSFGDLTSMYKLIKTSINLINCSTEQILTMSQNQLTRTDTFIWSVIIVIISNGNVTIWVRMTLSAK